MTTRRLPGRPGYGDLDGEERAARLIASMAASGYGARRIAEALNLFGFRPRHAELWEPGTVRQLITRWREEGRLPDLDPEAEVAALMQLGGRMADMSPSDRRAILGDLIVRRLAHWRARHPEPGARQRDAIFGDLGLAGFVLGSLILAAEREPFELPELSDEEVLPTKSADLRTSVAAAVDATLAARSRQGRVEDFDLAALVMQEPDHLAEESDP